MFVFVVDAYFYSFPKISLLVTHFLTLINNNSYDLSNAYYIKGTSLSALHVLAHSSEEGPHHSHSTFTAFSLQGD